MQTTDTNCLHVQRMRLDARAGVGDRCGLHVWMAGIDGSLMHMWITIQRRSDHQQQDSDSQSKGRRDHGYWRQESHYYAL